MKLTNKDKDYLKSIGYEEKDFAQIQRAAGKTDYEYQMQKIGQKKAIELLGRKNYLSGLARSAFHWTCVRERFNGEIVYFDSARLFRE